MAQTSVKQNISFSIDGILSSNSRDENLQRGRKRFNQEEANSSLKVTKNVEETHKRGDNSPDTKILEKQSGCVCHFSYASIASVRHYEYSKSNNEIGFIIPGKGVEIKGKVLENGMRSEIFLKEQQLKVVTCNLKLQDVLKPVSAGVVTALISKLTSVRCKNPILHRIQLGRDTHWGTNSDYRLYNWGNRNIQLLKDPMREIEDSPTESDIEQF
ncbi:hypothetical protein P5673_031256 [Acropora cervicornis]|uniref:Uncharacterized protein n=1 Tax=Acropora cervicornis TaxID=6130 RepID=A0AAD9USM8_ACRCE|nr:hypothetical protein P5673_031256 [Acropora cervicornis]